MIYIAIDGTALESVTGEVVTYTCPDSDMPEGVYESYESGLVGDVFQQIKVTRTVESGQLTYEITQLTQEEIDQYNASLIEDPQEESVWDKNAYDVEMNRWHNEWFSAIISPKPYEYASAEELPLWYGSEYDEEARKFAELYRQSWQMLKDYLEVVTEETINTDNIMQQINSLYYAS
jgi:hypothetical protein